MLLLGVILPPVHCSVYLPGGCLGETQEASERSRGTT
jgi:hypothetical protein